jgi:hypothetical protein
MAQSAVAANVHVAPDVSRYLPFEISLYPVPLVNETPNGHHLFIRERITLFAHVHTRLSQDLLGCAPANAINVGEGDLDSLVSGQFNTCNPCHTIPPSLPLPLLVPRIGTDDQYHPLSTYNLAVTTNGLY